MRVLSTTATTITTLTTTSAATAAYYCYYYYSYYYYYYDDYDYYYYYYYYYITLIIADLIHRTRAKSITHVMNIDRAMTLINIPRRCRLNVDAHHMRKMQCNYTISKTKIANTIVLVPYAGERVLSGTAYHRRRRT